MVVLTTLLLASFATFFRTINSFPLRNWDEAWYAEIIKNMATGNYSLLVPFWNGHYYFDKPPLYFWLSLPVFKVFGPGEWQARIISALASIMSVVLIYLIGKKLFNWRIGLTSTVIFLGLGQVVIRFAHGNLDSLLVCFSLLGFYFYLLSAKKRLYTILAGVSLGLGLLIKGYFIGFFPFLVIFIYSKVAENKLPHNLYLLISTALASSFWYFLLGTYTFGGSFIDWYVLNPAGSLLNSPQASFSLHYFKELTRDVGFWFILILFFVLKIKKLSQIDQKILLSLLMPVLILVFALNFLSEKLGWYNLPAYPMLAISIAMLCEKLYKKSPKSTILLITLILIAQIVNINRIENIYPDRSNVGATLGQHASRIIPKEETIILDDHDFTSFLYYSNHQEIYTVSDDGGKNWEWWTLKYSDLPEFTNNHPQIWIISPNPDKLLQIFGNLTYEDEINGYFFLKTKEPNLSYRL